MHMKELTRWLLVRCGPCKLLEPALDKLAEKLCSGQFERDGFPSPQVLRMDSDLHPAKVPPASSLQVCEFLGLIRLMLAGLELP